MAATWLASTNPAAAEFYIYLANGRVIFWPLLAVGIVLLMASALMLAWVTVLVMQGMGQALSGGSEPDPSDLESPEHYEHEAARARAIAHMLDAQAVADESRIRAERRRDELLELEELRNDKTARRNTGRR